MRHITHVIVRGLVQGVSFRAWTVGQAERRGVDGWVRNREDGGLEAILAGEADAIRGIVEAFRIGPKGAIVTDVIELPTSEEPGPGFHIRV
ncbi:MAG: acylphosphatase [Rhodospirillales bacterium]|nr:acylphosphatase [Rhodospirillales bacterium]